MLIEGVTNAGAIPALEAAAKFAARRHGLIAHNVANFSTPMHRPKDVSVHGFREQLGRAVDERRERFGGHRGELRLSDSREVTVSDGGTLVLHPRESGRNILFHDRNNRDVERTMQDLVENAAAFQVATSLLRSRMGLIRSAIAERVS